MLNKGKSLMVGKVRPEGEGVSDRASTRSQPWLVKWLQVFARVA